MICHSLQCGHAWERHREAGGGLQYGTALTGCKVLRTKTLKLFQGYNKSRFTDSLDFIMHRNESVDRRVFVRVVNARPINDDPDSLSLFGPHPTEGTSGEIRDPYSSGG